MLAAAVRRAPRLARNKHTSAPTASSHHLKLLAAQFRDPASPFFLPPGTAGPASPDDPPPSLAEHARARLAGMGYEAASLWEQPIAWGDHDAFQCVPIPPRRLCVHHRRALTRVQRT
jgi:hypothetical protein